MAWGSPAVISGLNRKIYTPRNRSSKVKAGISQAGGAGWGRGVLVLAWCVCDHQTTQDRSTSSMSEEEGHLPAALARHVPEPDSTSWTPVILGL